MEASSRLEFDGLLSGVEGAVFARGDADAHHGRARVLHDGADVGEVEVDEAGDGDEVGDALDALAQRVVGDAEGVEHAGLLVHDLQQAVVGDDDERVDLLGQQVDALLRLVAAQAAFEGERLGDDAHRESADLFARDLGDDGAAPVPVPPPSPAVTNTMSASASASRISARLSSAAWHPTSGFAPAPRPRVKLFADVDRLVGIRHEQRLAVGVDGDEFHAASRRPRPCGSRRSCRRRRRRRP